MRNPYPAYLASEGVSSSPLPNRLGKGPPADWKMVTGEPLSITQGLGKGIFYTGSGELFPSVYSCLP